MILSNAKIGQWYMTKKGPAEVFMVYPSNTIDFIIMMN